MTGDGLVTKLTESHEFHEDLLATVDLYPDEEEDYLTTEFFEAMVEQEEHRDFLLENNIITPRENGDGYVWNDFERVRNVVYETPISVPEVDTEPYSKFARGLLVSMILLAPAFRFGPLRELIGGLTHIVLGPLVALTSFLVVITVIAVGTSVFATVLRSRVRDMEKVEKLRERLDMMQTERYRLLQLDKEEEAKEYRNKMVFEEKVQFQLVREIFRETPYIISVSLPLFIWMLWMVNDVGVSETIPFPVISDVGVGFLYFSLIPAWIVWYFLVSIVTSQLLSLINRVI